MEKMENQNNSRDYSIDLLKVIAIIGVIFIHTCPDGFGHQAVSFNWTASLFYASITRASVPIFLMCSGALLLDPKRELSIKKLYSKNLLRVFLSMLFWGAAYKGYRLILGGEFTVALILQAVTDVIWFNQEFHLYYLHIMILVYIFLPITRIITQNADKKQLEYLLLVWFVFGIVYPTVKPFWPFTKLYGIPTQWMINQPYSAIGYGILGHYLRKYPLPRRSTYAIIFAAGFVFVFGGTFYKSFLQGYLYPNFLEGMSLGAALMAAGLFGYCTIAPLNFSPKLNNTLEYLSTASFCVYLVHLFFLYVFRYFGLTVFILPCIVSIPLIVLLVYISGCAAYAILSRIPIINKWAI